MEVLQSHSPPVCDEYFTSVLLMISLKMEEMPDGVVTKTSRVLNLKSSILTCQDELQIQCRQAFEDFLFSFE